MTTLLVDDHLLLRILVEDEPPELRPHGAGLATTGLWYHRLCRALSNASVVGALSRRLGDVQQAVAADVVSAVIELPDSIELVSLRRLGWPMGLLVNDGGRLNLLALEALAAARDLGAEICMSAVDANEPLRAAAEQLGVAVRVLAG